MWPMIYRWQTRPGKIFFGISWAVSTKSHANEKIKIHYFRTLRMRFDVFFDADSESAHMT